MTLIGRYKHTNINLTTEMGSDWLICHVLKTYLSPTIIISYNDFGHDYVLRCVYKLCIVPLNLEMSRPSMPMQLCVLLTKYCTFITLEVVSQSDRHGRINKRQSEECEHEFGIEIISFIKLSKSPAHQSHPV